MLDIYYIIWLCCEHFRIKVDDICNMYIYIHIYNISYILYIYTYVQHILHILYVHIYTHVCVKQIYVYRYMGWQVIRFTPIFRPITKPPKNLGLVVWNMVLYSHARKHVRRIPVRSSEWFPPKSGILWWFNGILWDFNGIYSDLMGFIVI